MPSKTVEMKKNWKRQGNRKLIIGILGLCLGLFGILCGMFWEKTFTNILAKQMILRPDSRVYDNWKRPPLDLNLDIYLFNWTNSDDFKNLSSKPILEQLGPYRFIEKPDKVDINWHPENSSVTYRRKSFFYFDADGSNGSLDDEVVTLNAVALSAAAKGKEWNLVRRKVLDVGLNLYSQEISVTKTVDELLFTGYNDDMIDIARTMPLFGQKVEVPFDKFGWFYTRNGSADLTGVFNVFTGEDDIYKIGQMHTWNYKRNIDNCGYTHGSAGEFQPPNLTPDDTVSLFTADMCRTIPLDYVETIEVEGLKGYKYAGGPRSVDNGTLYPENECSCAGECVPSGVMNISACRYGSPVFMSYPHFYNADPYFVNQVEGINPQKDKHEFYMIIEPRTGIALEVAARFQVNMLVEPIESISLYENIQRTFFPLIWFEQKVRITPNIADELSIIPIIYMCGHILAGICFVLGLILVCWYPIEQLWLNYHHIKSEEKSENRFDDKQYENGKQPSLKASTNSLNETRIRQKSIEKIKTSPDSSPLLEKLEKLPKMLIKSDTIDSIMTKSTMASISPTHNPSS